MCVCPAAANDKSRAVVRLRNVVMELRKVVNHPSLLGLDLDTPAYTRAVEARKAQAAAAMKARGESASTGALQHAVKQSVCCDKVAMSKKPCIRLVDAGSP
jgi:hypothetical protein